MSRLIDDIRREGVAMPWFITPSNRNKWKNHMMKILAFLREDIPVIVIDNVSTYYFESSGQENWDIVRDFPNLAPPYQVFWMEHRMPRVIHSDTKGDTDIKRLLPESRGGRVGALIFGLPREQVKGEGIPDAMRWTLCFEIFIDYGVHRGRIDGSPGTINLAVDGEGRLIDVPWMQSWTVPEHDEQMKDYITWTHPFLLTISFLHCKNVQVVDNPVPPKLARRFREKHGFAPADYKALVIEPLKQILRTEGRSGEVGLAKAMHICRGHFRDYRQGKGLFGKYHQLVWQDAIVRGTKGEKAPPREIEVKL